MAFYAVSSENVVNRFARQDKRDQVVAQDPDLRVIDSREARKLNTEVPCVYDGDKKVFIHLSGR